MVGVVPSLRTALWIVVGLWPRQSDGAVSRGPLWSLPKTIAGDLNITDDGWFDVVSHQNFTCTASGLQPTSEPKGPDGAGPAIKLHPNVFLIEDVSALGHMQMSFAALFSFLVQQPSGAHVAVAWERPAGKANALNETFAAIRSAYYEPLLGLLTRHFAREKGMTLESLPRSADRTCYRTGRVTVRRCMAGYDEACGHCGAWFATPGVVVEWRRFLAQSLGHPMPPYGGARPACRPNTERWAVLVFDRARRFARSFRHPERLRAQVARHLNASAPAVAVAVDYYQHPARRFEATNFTAQCDLFARYDLIIMAHGGAMSNLVCARACAMVVEVGFQPDGMYAPLALQLGLVRCWVQADSTFHLPVMPKDPRRCLDQFVAMHAGGAMGRVVRVFRSLGGVRLPALRKGGGGRPKRVDGGP